MAPTSPVEGGKVIPGKPQAQETVEAAPASPIEGGKVIPSKAAAITDIKEGQRVQVTYHTVNGKMHATQVRVMATGDSRAEDSSDSLRILERLLDLLADVLVVLRQQLLFLLGQDSEGDAYQALLELHVQPVLAILDAPGTWK